MEIPTEEDLEISFYDDNGNKYASKLLAEFKVMGRNYMAFLLNEESVCFSEVVEKKDGSCEFSLVTDENEREVLQDVFIQMIKQFESEE